MIMARVASRDFDFAYFMGTNFGMAFADVPISENSPHHLAAALRDQARGTLIARVDPQPAHRDAQPVAQADQEIDVGDAPDPPRDGAAQLDAPEIDHRLPLADLRQAAGMLVTERGHRSTFEARLDGVGDVTSLLLGRRCDAGDRLSIGTCDSNGVANGEDIGMAGNGEVGQNLQAAGAVRRSAEPFGGG